MTHAFISKHIASLEYPWRPAWTANFLYPYHCNAQLTLTCKNSYDPANTLDDISGLHCWTLHESPQSRTHESKPFCEQSDPNQYVFLPWPFPSTLMLRFVYTAVAGACHEVLMYNLSPLGSLGCYQSHQPHGIAVASAQPKRPSDFAGQLSGCIVSSLSTNGLQIWCPWCRYAELVSTKSLLEGALNGRTMLFGDVHIFLG